MMKTIKLLISIALAIIAIWGLFLWENRPSRIVPYPYVFDSFVPEGLERAENSDVLLVGGRLTSSLEGALKVSMDQIEKHLAKPLKLYNWAQSGEGLHRALHKMRQLKKYPKVVIFAGSDELVEKSFELNDHSAIFANFQRLQNEKIGSLIITFPWLSKFLYKSTDLIHFGQKMVKNKQAISDQNIYKVYELSYYLFQQELREMIELSKQKKFSLFLMTSPLNLDVPPQKSCNHSFTTDVVDLVRKIEKLIRNQNVKEAYNLGKKLKLEVQGNAHVHYVFGKAAYFAGKQQEAMENLYLATLYDCVPWRTNHAYNMIIRKMANQYSTPLFDFDDLINSYYGRNILFLDELYPQSIFYRVLGENLRRELKEVLEN